MNSVFDTEKVLQSFYDLKGSTIGRKAKPGQDVKKDNDVREGYPDTCFTLPPHVKETMRNQIVRDCGFLKEMKIMDYSMLVGVHHIPSKHASSNKNASTLSGLRFRDNSMRSVQELLKTRKSAMVRARSDSAYAMSTNRSHLLLTSSNFPTDNDYIERKTPKRVEFVLHDDEVQDENNDFPDEIARPGSAYLSKKFSLSLLSAVSSSSTIGVNEDEDYSYLEIPNNRYPTEVDNASTSETEKLNKRREDATEQIYWPFHRMYEINGQRRVIPLAQTPTQHRYLDPEEAHEYGAHDTPRRCTTSCLGDPQDYDPDIAGTRAKWALTDFVRPISNRKDGGLTMDVSGQELPMKIEVAGKGVQYCDGKIFYMGIIDVLQQFNVRKRAEARWRRLLGGGWDKASCVHPSLYAERFIDFFDEYTRHRNELETNNEGVTEEVIFTPSNSLMVTSSKAKVD